MSSMRHMSPWSDEEIPQEQEEEDDSDVDADDEDSLQQTGITGVTLPLVGNLQTVLGRDRIFLSLIQEFCE